MLFCFSAVMLLNKLFSDSHKKSGQIINSLKFYHERIIFSKDSVVAVEPDSKI